MSMTKQEILEQAMALDPKDREAIAEELWSSVEHVSERELDEAWAREAQDRVEAYRRGEMSAKPVNEVIERLLNRRKAS